MIRYLSMILVLAAGAVIQQLLPGWPLFGGLKPPVLAALAFYYALRRESAEMWTTVFIAALLHDGLELGSFGPALVAFPVLGIVANRVRKEIFADGLVTQLVFGAFTGLVIVALSMLIYSITRQRPLSPGLILLRLFGALLLGAATLPLVSVAINKLEAILPKRRRYGW